MSNLTPIHIKDRLIKFVVYGSPKVQKNDLVIMKRSKRGGGTTRMIGHSGKMKGIRDIFTFEVYKQYINQGYKDPIDYFINIGMVFYTNKSSEPDLDNLIALPLDAMEGVKHKGGLKVAQVLKNDKLVRKITARKIVKGDIEYNGEPRTEIEISPY